MIFSCCIWALSEPEETVLTRIAELGFTWIDLRPHLLRTPAAQTRARELNLQVSCMAANFGLPGGASLDSRDEGLASQALAGINQAMEQAAGLGATAAYVVPGLDDTPATLDRYGLRLGVAADRARELGLKLCVEHFPGRALPTAAATLDFLQKLDHPNLYLLFDIGHIQMADEDPADVVRTAGPRLGYVHLDDNDGVNDQHLSLLDGVLTKTVLQETFAALLEIEYTGAVSLELNPELADPLTALRQSREITLDVARAAGVLL